jgi:hypothetical protein
MAATEGAAGAAGKAAGAAGKGGKKSFEIGGMSPGDMLGHAANVAGIGGTVMQLYGMVKGSGSESTPPPKTTKFESTLD